MNLRSYGPDVSDPQRVFSSLSVLLHCGLLAQLPASPCLGCHDCCGCLLRLLESLQEALWGKGIAAPQPRVEMLPEVLAMDEMVSQEEAGPHPSQRPVPSLMFAPPELGWCN